MSDLSGDLGSFNVREVLELLSDFGKTGELRLTSGTVVGRALLRHGNIAYATTATDVETSHELEALLNRGAVGATGSVDTALREQLTEVFYELTQFESGAFEFVESEAELSTREGDFSVADVLSDVDARVEAWREIRTVIPSTDEPYRMASRLPTHSTEVTVDSQGWSIISSVGESGSVSDVAATLGRSEFQIAQSFAALIPAGLLEPIGDPVFLSSDESAAEFDMPRIEPTTPAVTISKEDLTREEMDEMIRNIGKGIYPGA